MQALELLNAGKIDEAIASAIELVRSQPTATGAREILVELFCLQGDLVRADKQAEAILVQQPTTAVTTSLLRQLIRAETSRKEFWREGRVPEFLGDVTDLSKRTLQAFVEWNAGHKQEAMTLLSSVDETAPSLSGVCNEMQFEGIRDLDDFCAHHLEVLTSTGKYYWVPFEKIESMQFESVTRPRDLLWRQCHLIVKDGPDGVVYIPVLYQLTDSAENSDAKLGRATDWVGADGELVSGVGQRTFLVGEQELGIMELNSVVFSDTEAT